MKKGFTLIELLVVIVIIMILAAVLFPVYSKVQEKALATRCLSNLKQIGLGMALYANEHGGYMVPFGLVDETLGPDGKFKARDAICGIPILSWVENLGPYLKTKDVFRHGPKDTAQPCAWGPVQWAGQIGGIGPGQWGYGGNFLVRTLAYQLNPVVHMRNGAIGWNDGSAGPSNSCATFRADFDAFVNGGTYVNPNTGAVSIYDGSYFERLGGDGSFKGWAPTLHESQMHQPTRLISAIDSRAAYVDGGSRYSWGAGRTGWGQPSMAGQSNRISTPHSDYANVLYCDGHVGQMKQRGVWAESEREAAAWTNSPYDDGGLYNRMGTADTLDDVYYTNIIPYRHHGISVAWYPDNETIFEMDGTYGEYNTVGRPLGPSVAGTAVDRFALYGSAPSTYWTGQAFPYPYQPD